MFCTKKMGLKSVFAIVLLFVILTSALGVVSANSVITVNVGQTVYVNHGSPWLELPGFNGLKWTDLMYDTASMSCWVGEGIIGISGRRPTNGQAKYVDFSWCCQVYYGPGRYEDYTGSGYVYVIVTDNNPPSGITLPSTASISYNGSTTLDAVLKPANAMSFLTWSSSNTNVATVSPQGVVKAVKPGTATITVSTHNGLTARCNLTVTPPKPVVNSVSPKSGETGVSCDSVIKCVFSSTVYKSTKFSSVSVVDKTTNKAVPFTPELTGSDLVLKPSSRLTPGHSYSVKIPAGAIENSYDVPLQKDYEWTFRAENLELLTKKAGEGGYADIGDKATFGFSTSVSKGSQWNNITFEDTKQNKSVDFTARISGKEIIITPGSELDYYTDYKVTLPAGSLKNPVGGELENDIVLSFTTKDVKPEVISYTPDDDPDRTDVDTSVFLYFNTEVFKSDNFDKIRFCNAITGEEVPCEISCSSRYVSYHAEDDLSPITDYLFHMPENAIANITGDGNDAFTLRFTTMAPDDPEFSGVSASISIENDLFGNDDILELFATEGADIYYTLDGTDPRSFGELYTKPVDLPDTFKTIIRAVAVKDGALSEVVQRIFTNGELAGETVFADNYGVKGEYTEYRDMIQTDGGYILVGDNVIEKRDFDGSVLWRTTYEDYYFTGVTEVSDGYIAVSDDENTYCSKIDKNGNALWTKNGGSFWAAAVTGDNGDCVAVGGNGIRKINKDGDVIWSSSAGSEVYLRDIVSVDDGYVACGNSGDDAILVKFDKSGTRMWFRTFDSYGDECFWGTEKTKDGFVVAGHCDNFGRGDFEGTDNGEALLVWVDNDGNLTGSASYNADGFMDITATDSGFAIAGNEYFFEIDKNGGIIFKNKLNGAYMECIIKSGRTCVMAGGAYGRSFGDYELENLTAIGSKDGVFFIFKDKELYNAPSEMNLKAGKISLIGSEAVYKNDRFFVPVCFIPSSDISRVDVELVYSKDIYCYFFIDSDYEIDYDDYRSGDEMVLNIECDFSDQDMTVRAGEPVILAYAKFMFEEDGYSFGDYSISFNPENTYCTDLAGNRVPFDAFGDYNFRLEKSRARDMFIIGRSAINKAEQYRVSTFPGDDTDFEISWSVSDRSVASVDETGTVKPLRNGQFNLIADNGYLRATKPISITGVKQYISDWHIEGTKVHAKVTANSSDMKNALLIKAAYNNEGKLIKVSRETITESQSEYNVEFDCSGINDDFELKFIFVQNLAGLVPVNNSCSAKITLD